jgi:hypothetical protein
MEDKRKREERKKGKEIKEKEMGKVMGHQTENQTGKSLKRREKINSPVLEQ